MFAHSEKQQSLVNQLCQYISLSIKAFVTDDFDSNTLTDDMCHRTDNNINLQTLENTSCLDKQADPYQTA